MPCAFPLRIAHIPGDGIGPEVTAEALRVLKAVHPDITITDYDCGAARYIATGETLTDEDIASLRTHDAILLGAIGAPDDVPPGILERGLLLRLRFALDHYVNLRPSKLYPGMVSPLRDPGEIDFVVIREGTEGLYAGNGGTLRAGTQHEIASEVSQNTRFGVERVVRYAFEVARGRRHHITLVHKKNVLVYAGDLWARTVADVAQDYPDVTVDYAHIDAATIYLVTDPSRFDVIVTDNLFGDILTDEAGAICGGIGLAASGNIDASRANPSMFEPVHGSAPDIAGRGIADPRAAILSVSLLLQHVGDRAGAEIIERAVQEDIARAPRGQGQTSTRAIGDRILAAVESQ